MPRLRLTIAVGDYDLTAGLVEGTIVPDGVDPIVLTMHSPERHWRMLRHEEFDVAELSMSSYLVARSRGLPFIAIPVFPHRRFRHSYIFVRAGSKVERPADLKGGRVGLREFQNTAALWVRGILEEHYGLAVTSVTWMCQDEEDVPFTPPPGLRLERVPKNRTVDEMLRKGELDAVIYPELLSSFKRGSPEVRRLFTDAKQEEIAYFRKTGIFPIMHTVVLKEALWRECPWVAANVLKAFQQAKELAYARLQDPRRVALAWVRELLEEQREILGPDPWPYDLPANRHTLETLIRYSHQQGLIPKPFVLEELFAPNTIGEGPVGFV